MKGVYVDSNGGNLLAEAVSGLLEYLGPISNIEILQLANGQHLVNSLFPLPPSQRSPPSNSDYELAVNNYIFGANHYDDTNLGRYRKIPEISQVLGTNICPKSCRVDLYTVTFGAQKYTEICTCIYVHAYFVHVLELQPSEGAFLYEKNEPPYM